MQDSLKKDDGEGEEWRDVMEVSVLCSMLLRSELDTSIFGGVGAEKCSGTNSWSLVHSCTGYIYQVVSCVYTFW